MFWRSLFGIRDDGDHQMLQTHEFPASGRLERSTPGSSVRFLLYSHDSWGLGHLRRSLAIAGALTSRFRDAHVLLVTGSPCATHFDLPPNCDVLKLPSISKDGNGSYVPRSLPGDLARMVELRRRLLLEANRAFQPDLLVIDHQLTGLHSEALDMLREARACGRRIIYGMRDVIDSPEVVEAGWNSDECRWALRECYDRICVYGQASVFDPREHYPALAPVADKVEFAGYVVAPLRDRSRPPLPTLKPRVLVTVGGGEDGGERIECYLAALALKDAQWTSRIITGPLMDHMLARHYKRMVHRLGLSEHVRISRFHANIPGLLRASDAVVSMAGYNTSAEILQSRVPAIFLPRTSPRKEQLIRARRFQELQLATCIEELDPHAVRAAIESALRNTGFRATSVSLQGLDGLCSMVSRLLEGDATTSAPKRVTDRVDASIDR